VYAVLAGEFDAELECLCAKAQNIVRRR